MGRRWFASLVLVLACLALVHPTPRLAAQITPMCVSGCIPPDDPPPPNLSVDVTPDGTSLGSKAVNTTGLTAVFTVKNNGDPDSYNATCSGALTTCTLVSPASFALGTGGTRTVTVTYTVGSVAGAGTVRLQVRSPTTDGGDGGYYTLTVTAVQGPPVVATLPRNRPDQLERGLCLTAGAGEAAWQCGDLIVSHAMPAYTTLGRDRSLALVYNSATAAPRPTVIATVTAPAGILTPPNVVAELSVGPSGGSQTLRASATYNAWGTGASAVARQIALSYDASADPTGTYDYTLVVKNNYATPQSATMTGKLIVVNRSTSRFGRGWALAGVERIYPNGTGPILWVAGDGSARIYAPVTTNTWVAPAAAYRDTLRYNTTTTQYTRTLRHGVTVTYDVAGRHLVTTNRITQPTTFAWGGTGDSLVSIAVPPVGVGGSYQIVYDGTTSGKVDKLRDPGPSGGRALDLTVNTTTGQLTGIVDPDAKGVGFGYDATTKVMTSRTNRQNYATTFGYSANLKVVSAVVPYGTNGSLLATTGFQPWDTLGLAVGTGNTNKEAVDTGLVFSKIFGPRPVADDATFYVDRWGAPVKTIDPLGASTFIERTSGVYPALVTKVTYPNGRYVTMTYDTAGTLCCRGNLMQVLDNTTATPSPLPTKSTTYAYAVGTPDAPIQVTDALGRVTRYAYTGLGQVDSTIDARGHVTKFVYDSVPGASLRGSIMQVIERSVETWEEAAGAGDDQSTTDSLRNHITRYGYNAKGNVDSVAAPHGAVTSYAYDGYGRADSSWNALGMMTELVFDPLNRVTEQRQYTTPKPNPFGTTLAAGMSLDPTQVLAGDSSKAFAPALPSMLSAFTQYSDTAMDVAGPLDPTAKRHFSYDPRYSLIKTRDELQVSSQVVADAAGLVTSTTSRNGETVTFTYDNGGRRLTTTYPSRTVLGQTIAGDVITNTYSPVTGDLLTASNKEGTTVRTYYGDGSVQSRIFTRAGTSLADTLRYSYNPAGQRTQLIHGPDTTDYGYHPTTGDLQTLTVRYGKLVNLTRTLTFTWDALGRRRQITYPGGLIVTYRYDKLGTVRRVKATHPSNNNLSFTYVADGIDALGQILSQTRRCFTLSSGGSGGPGANGLCGGEPGPVATTYNRYNRLGMMVTSGAALTHPDSVEFDAGGNLSARTPSALGESRHVYTIDPKTNRLSTESYGGLTTTFSYDANGARLQEIAGGIAQKKYYYDGMGRINGLEYIGWNGSGYQPVGGPNRCAYDPDGQMLDPCDNFAPLLVYDGANVVGTLSTVQAGQWAFVQGPGLDDPLIGVDRSAGTVHELAWVTDGNGRQYAVGRISDGQEPTVFADVVGYWGWQWVGGTKLSYGFAANRQSTSNSPADAAKPAAFAVFRNRLYDPQTGRWTQEDPIGIAGGLNLYQFNNNNPAMFTDPFGLKADSVKVIGAQSTSAVAYLNAKSSSFRTLFNALDADPSVKLTIRDPQTPAEGVFPSQFTSGADGQGVILFNSTDMNQSNYDRPAGAGWIQTAASVMGHELGHAGGHYGKLPAACAGDPPTGQSGCIVNFENKVRSELPPSERGGIRPAY